MRKFMVGAVWLALLAACGEKPAETAATAPEAAASAAPVPAAPCSGPTLPVTGACADASPALFIAIDDKAPMVGASCVWRTEEVKLSEDEAIVFRAQDCAATPADKWTYARDNDYITYRLGGAPADQAGAMVKLFKVGDGQTAEQVAKSTLSEAPADQRDRCETRPLTHKVAGRSFELAPNDALKAQLEKERSADEPWDACGPNGVTMDSTVFWEGREHRALYHMTGQDDPAWDPASFTFYVKNPDGSWSKKD